MSGLLRLIAWVVFGAGITLGAGFVHGRLTQRWGPVPDLQAAAEKLETLPREIGDWQLTREEPIPAPVVQLLSCAGYVNRHYKNRQSQQEISIAIFVGPPGPTAAHTPEICYSSRAYSIQDPRKQVQLLDNAGGTHSFWSLTLRSNIPTMDRQKVYYAWRSGSNWRASESPRFEFAGGRLLYKLQMAVIVPGVGNDKENDPCQEFLTALLRSGWDTSD